MLVERQTEVPQDVIEAGEGGLLSVSFLWHPGTEPSGMSGPPENYDPGDGPEVDIEQVEMDGVLQLLDEEQDEALVNWIAENYFEVEDDWPEPDYDPFDDGY